MTRVKRLAVLFFVAAIVMLTAVTGAAQGGFEVKTDKRVVQGENGTYDVSFSAYQTGRVIPLDIVMVLDVSGSMENNVAVKTEEIRPDEDYYIEFLWNSGNGVIQGKKYKVTNTAPVGENAVWTADIEGEKVIATPIEPGTAAKEKGEYVFYTGAIDDLKTAAAGFVSDIAKSAEENGVDHRIAVVEFSSPIKKGEDSLGTHEHEFYANILTGKSPSSALVSAKDKAAELNTVFASLKAEGPTYSDDALMQAKRIFEENPAEGRKRVVVLFTDGGPGSYGWSSKTVDLDESSIPTANAAIACANELKSELAAEVYTIGFFDADELDLSVKEKNRKYLAYISSNHSSAVGMSDTSEPVIGGYCHINDSDSDLNSVFEKISTVLGDALDNVNIKDTISRYFYLTSAQEEAIKSAYPNAVISENSDGTTTVSIENVALEQIMVDSDGNPVDENDKNIFRLNYSMTKRADFIGGASVPVDTGKSGVYGENGNLLFKVETPETAVEVSQEAMKQLIELKSPSVSEGEAVRAEDFFADKSDGWFSDFSEITYSVTDKSGNAVEVLEATADRNGELFTVTANVRADGKAYTVSGVTTLTVVPDEIVGIEISENIKKTSYFVGDDLDTDGFKLNAVYKSGKRVLVTENIAFSPMKLEKAGTQEITVRYGDFEVCFDVRVISVTAVELIIKEQPARLRYFVGDTFDSTGAVLAVRYNNGTEKRIAEGYSCNYGKFTSAGIYTVFFEYENVKAFVTATVESVKAVSARVKTLPTNTEFTYKQSPDFSGLSVEITYNNGDKKTVDSIGKMQIKRLTDSGTRRGSVQFSVSVEGVSDTFEMNSVLRWWQWIILILLLGFIWY